MICTLGPPKTEQIRVFLKMLSFSFKAEVGNFVIEAFIVIFAGNLLALAVAVSSYSKAEICPTNQFRQPK